MTFLVFYQKDQQNDLKPQADTQPTYLLSGFGSEDKNDTGLIHSQITLDRSDPKV